MHLGPDASWQGQQGPGKQEDEGQAQGPGPDGVLCLGQRLVGCLLRNLLFLQAPSCSACCPQAGIQTEFRHYNLATPFAHSSDAPTLAWRARCCSVEELPACMQGMTALCLMQKWPMMQHIRLRVSKGLMPVHGICLAASNSSPTNKGSSSPDYQLLPQSRAPCRR